MAIIIIGGGTMVMVVVAATMMMTMAAIYRTIPDYPNTQDEKVFTMFDE